MEVFPEYTVYLFDFHREQAWERWVWDHHHKLSKDGDELLSLLRECSLRPQENLPHDHYYNLALKQTNNKHMQKQSKYCNPAAHAQRVIFMICDKLYSDISTQKQWQFYINHSVISKLYNYNKGTRTIIIIIILIHALKN